MSNKKVALVIGASGLVGGNLANHIATLPGWTALGVSRTKPAKAHQFTHISIDLLDKDQCHQALARYPEITHVFIAARTKGATPEIEERNNLSVVGNLLDTLEQTAPGLEHVHLVHGTKWYGAHLPNTTPPFRESDPRRVMPPNPYYAQYDYLVDRQEGREWSWSTSRPALIFGYSTGYPHNIVCLVGIFAAMCRELGMQFRFPGSEWTYKSLQPATDIDLLCRGIVHIASSENGRNQTFNVGNGDVFSWSNLWPRVAGVFGMEHGTPQQYSLLEYLSDKDGLWERMVQKYDLKQNSLSDLVKWSYGDFHFNRQGSDITSLIKINKAGFSEVTDSEDLFMEVLERYREERIIPR